MLLVGAYCVYTIRKSLICWITQFISKDTGLVISVLCYFKDLCSIINTIVKILQIKYLIEEISVLLDDLEYMVQSQ